MNQETETGSEAATHFYLQSLSEIKRLKGLLETMVKGFASCTLADSSLENIEQYWLAFKEKNNI